MEKSVSQKRRLNRINTAARTGKIKQIHLFIPLENYLGIFYGFLTFFHYPKLSTIFINQSEL